MPGDLSYYPTRVWDGWTRNPDRAKQKDGAYNRHVESDPDFHDWDRVRDETIALQILGGSSQISKPVADVDLEPSVIMQVVLVDTTTGDVQVKLPDPSIQGSVPIVVKKIDVSGNEVDIIGYNSELIDGLTPRSLTSQYDAITLVGDGTGWWII